MSQKVAYVTGGMGGIGTAICQRLHKEGFKVIAGCGPTRDHAKWIAEQAEQGFTFYASAGNVGNWESTVEAFAKVKAEHGIVDLLIADLAKRLQANRLNLSVSESAKAAIIKNGADPLFGARPLKRYIQGHIESLLARFIIENSPEEGSTLTVDADEKGSFIIGQKQ